MKDQVTIFGNDMFGDLRIINIKGEPWFVLRDVCNILDISKTYDVIKRLDSDEHQKAESRLNRDSRSNEPITIINESGLYSVILRSDKPNARAFRKWVTSEVLPSIRKTGKYEITDAGKKAMRDATRSGHRLIDNLVALIIHKWNVKVQNRNRLHSRVMSTEMNAINTSVYGQTASEWKQDNPDLPGNVRDNSDMDELVLVTGLQFADAAMLLIGTPKDIRHDTIATISKMYHTMSEDEGLQVAGPGFIVFDDNGTVTEASPVLNYATGEILTLRGLMNRTRVPLTREEKQLISGGK